MRLPYKKILEAVKTEGGCEVIYTALKHFIDNKKYKQARMIMVYWVDFLNRDIIEALVGIRPTIGMERTVWASKFLKVSHGISYARNDCGGAGVINAQVYRKNEAFYDDELASKLSIDPKYIVPRSAFEESDYDPS